MVGFGLMAADDDDVEHFEKRTAQLNSIGGKPATVDMALQRISTETGVPIESVRAQHKRHPDIGVAGLMLANVLANDTKKAPEYFLTQRANGKKWLAMARANKVPVERLNERLDRLSQAIKGKKD